MLPAHAKKEFRGEYLVPLWDTSACDIAGVDKILEHLVEKGYVNEELWNSFCKKANKRKDIKGLSNIRFYYYLSFLLCLPLLTH